MASYEMEDAQGNRYRISKGAGPDYPHPENIGAGSSLVASGLLQGVPFESLVAANDFFWTGTLCKMPDCPAHPGDALASAIASSYLTIEKLDTALAIDDDIVDPRAGLRVQIQQALTQIIAGERAEAAMFQRQMDQESSLNKALIYTGAFMQGIGSSAWGLAVWAKEVSDLVNPVVIISNQAKAIQAGWESDDFASVYSETYLKGQKRELVEVLGFDPTAITEQQIDEAIAMASLVLDDPSLKQMLYSFVKDYAEAQHSIEITEVAGSGAFEIILTIILAAVTGGAGVIAAVGSKSALIRKFQKVGDLLSDFARATRKLKLQGKKRKAKSKAADFKDLETTETPVTKTDARGAENNSGSKPNNTANASVPQQVPMSQEKYDEIINLENPNRPKDVGEYLPQDYVEEHLNKFKEEGGAFIVIEEWIDNPEYTSLPGNGKFVGLSSEMDLVIDKYKASGNQWEVLRDELNLGENVNLSSTRISYVKLEPNDPRFEYSMPTGNERGAYKNEWVPGGYTKSGTSEAILSGGDVIVHNNNIDNLDHIPGIKPERIK